MMKKENGRYMNCCKLMYINILQMKNSILHQIIRISMPRSEHKFLSLTHQLKSALETEKENPYYFRRLKLS